MLSSHLSSMNDREVRAALSRVVPEMVQGSIPSAPGDERATGVRSESVRTRNHSAAGDELLGERPLPAAE
jgi:hypothetical protein